MEYIKPEEVGISSKNILNMIQKFDNTGLNMHSVIIARYGKVCYEAYWKPFHKDFAHRIYSITKSFVAIAVGFLLQDGLIDINDKILKYFPDMIPYMKNEGLKEQTIRDMLMMATASDGYNWFLDKPSDRVRNYFETVPANKKVPGAIFTYDSNGSFVLCALVERVSKMSFLDFMREKLFDKIGMSDKIECLKCPGGHSWGDSALIMPAQDLLKFALFVMNKGSFNGKQILNKEYIEEAIKKQIDNCANGTNTCNNQGYGYQIWRTYDNSFAFLGMGNQDVICVPDKDLIFICNADNQGIDYSRKFIIDNFFELISRKASDTELTGDELHYNELKAYTDNLCLSVAKGKKIVEYAGVINGKTFELSDNPMGIKNICLEFSGSSGRFKYSNEQGDKEIEFGLCENIYQNFPHTGYCEECATVGKANHTYKCAASAAWIAERKLYIKVQIIDKYFGNLHINIEFNDNGKIGLCMNKNAEDFLNEYSGYAVGK